MTPEEKRAKAAERQRRYYHERRRAQPAADAPAGPPADVCDLRAELRAALELAREQRATIDRLLTLVEHLTGLQKRDADALGKREVCEADALGFSSADASHNRARASDRISSSLLSNSQDPAARGSEVLEERSGSDRDSHDRSRPVTVTVTNGHGEKLTPPASSPPSATQSPAPTHEPAAALGEIREPERESGTVARLTAVANPKRLEPPRHDEAHRAKALADAKRLQDVASMEGWK
jgi:hypothetical protein